MSGRPLRFLGGLAAAWVGWRAIMLWPQAAIGPVPLLAIPSVEASVPAWRAEVPVPATRRPEAAVVAPAGVTRAVALLAPVPLSRTAHVDVWGAAMTEAEGETAPLPMAGQSTSPLGLPDRIDPAARAGHWSGSAWLVLRGGDRSVAGLTRGQLGGGQAGVRIAYALGVSPAPVLAVVARITSPTRGPGREAAIGIEWRPTRLPVRLVAEQRVMIDGGRGGPALGAIGGFGPAPVAAGFDLESYAQGGAVWRTRTEPFIEGAVRLAHPVAAAGPARIDLGLGLSGGAQRGAARLDVGPSVGVRLPIAGRSARLSLDWRQRVAGDARPGSGVALTLGGDF